MSMGIYVNNSTLSFVTLMLMKFQAQIEAERASQTDKHRLQDVRIVFIILPVTKILALYV